MLMIKRMIITIGLFLTAGSAWAVDGYDIYNHTRISIVAGDRIAVNEDLGVYIWNEKRMAAVEIEDITKRGDDIELHVVDKKKNKFYFFEISADDPGIDRLPQFDPGLPFPEVLSPEVHMKHDLLEARGNMTDRGNQLENGNLMDRGNRLDQGNLLEKDTSLPNEHLLYQGLQPVE